MARVEKIATDEGIQDELDIYNTLIPEAGQLCATLFIELTSAEAMREWLPNLVGIERPSCCACPTATRCAAWPRRSTPSSSPGQHVTAAVHYITFELGRRSRSPPSDPGRCWPIDHPHYREETELGRATLSELLDDLGGDRARDNCYTAFTDENSWTIGSGQARPMNMIRRRAETVTYCQRADNCRRAQSCRSKRSYGESWGRAGGWKRPCSTRTMTILRWRRKRFARRAMCASPASSTPYRPREARVWGGATERERRRMIRQRAPHCVALTG